MKLKHLIPLIENELKALDTPKTREAYRQGKFPLSDRVKDLNTRYVWDLFHAISFTKRDNFLTEAYKIGHDSHIQTVLRHIIKPL